MDVSQILYLYMSQVYLLAEYLGILEEIRLRILTTDTYLGGSPQGELIYRIPSTAWT